MTQVTSEYRRILDTFEQLLATEMRLNRSDALPSPAIAAALALIVSETGHQISERLLTMRDDIPSSHNATPRRLGLETAATVARSMTGAS